MKCVRAACHGVPEQIPLIFHSFTCACPPARRSASRMPDHLGLDLNIKGESFKVPLKNFTGRSDDNAIQGKLNGGGIAVTLTTSDGHIKLVYL